MRLLIDATLPLIPQCFPAPFILQTYSCREELEKGLPKTDALICRSTLKVDAALLKNTRLRYVATASSGTDHIDTTWLNKQSIQLLDAKGCNAHSVADYVLCMLAALRRKGIVVGIKAGLIGCGAVGSEVLRRLQLLGFEVQVFDPLRALAYPDFKSCALKDLSRADVLFIHAALHDDAPFASRNLLNHDFLSALQPRTILINAARGGIVNERDLLQLSVPVYYCTDVYSGEPNIDPDIVAFATFCTPHIAGHSIQGKEKAVYLLSQQFHQLAGLKPPIFPETQSENPVILQSGTALDDAVLAQYDPALETGLLKKSAGDPQVFQQVRSKHNQRQDFFLVP